MLYLHVIAHLSCRLLSSAGCLMRGTFFDVMRNEMRNYISRQIGRQVSAV